MADKPSSADRGDMPLTDPAGHRDDAPMLKANVISRMFYSWATPLMKAGYDHPLEESDLFSLGDEYSAKRALASFTTEFGAALAEYKASVGIPINGDNPTSFHVPAPHVIPLAVPVRALWKAFGQMWAMAGLLKFIGDACALLIPVCLAWVVGVLSDCQALARDGAGGGDAEPYCNAAAGYGSVAAIFLLQVASTLWLNGYTHLAALSGMRVRTALITAMAGKALKLSNTARAGEWHLGKIVNLVSTDTNRLSDQAIPSFHQLWTAPLQVLVSMILMINFIGWPALVGFGFLLAFVPLQSRAMALVISLRRASQKVTDRRIKLITELLQGIKVVKLLSWESPFLAKIDAEREEELGYVTRVAVWRSVVVGLGLGTPALAAVCVFASYAAAGNPLVPSLVFGSLSLLNLARMPLWQIPQVYLMILDSRISLRRITDMLVAPEADSMPTVTRSGDPAVPAIAIDGASFAWDSTAETGDVYMRDVSLHIRKGEFVAVVGRTSAGKTALLSAILGEMKRVAGTVHLDGRVAYCPQTPFLMTASIQQNVVFGSPTPSTPAEQARYEAALHYSALDRDLAQFEAGDATEVDAQVVSGGQRSRIALARALFADADIYLLDSVTAPLDAHVSAFVIDECLRKHLAGRTRVMVTHNLAHAALADRILICEGGRIVDQGSLAEIKARGGFGAELFRDQALSNDASESEAATLNETTSATAVVPAPATAASAKAGAGKLVQAEERERGAVRGEYYSRYVAYAGGWLPVSLLIAFVAATQGVRVANDLALVWWTRDAFSWTLGQWVALYAGLGLAQAVLAVGSNVAFVFAGVQASRRMHQAALYRLAYAPLALFESTPLGRMLARLSKDVDVADNSLLDSFRIVLRSLAALLSIFAVMIAGTPAVAIVLVVLLVIFYFVQRFFRATSRELKRLEAVTRSPLYAEISEAIAGISTIRAFGDEPRFLARTARSMDRTNRPFFLQVTAARWLAVRIEFLGACVTAACALFAVIARESMSPALLGLILSYALQATSMLNNNVFQIANAESGLNTVERLDAYATQLPQERGTPGDMADRTQRGEPPLDLVSVPTEWPARGEIVFDDVHLAYANGVPVLKGVTARIPAGARVVCVGSTGSGKSSLLSALLRIVEPTGGTVTIDGIDVSRVPLHDVRSRIAVIPQDPVLFAGTVRDNVDRFSEHDDAAVWSALEHAGMRETVAGMDGKLEAAVAAGGANLSLGERSCLCLARAMLVARRIVCMDEASGAMDEALEQRIQHAIRTGFPGVTMFVVAHRLSTVVDADFVMYLEGGKVVEFAQPHELLQRPGSRFRAMVDATGPATAEGLYRAAAEAYAARKALD
ncbi:hypothetical protein H9P43_003063 [Blastocladiella emersonii ATCC 22665]|nr:hypothetical protein H9P43_003063 [Blastocladiella emersonii ATCC 22665]